MAGDDDAASDHSKDTQKSSRSHFWRDKLKDKASKLTKPKSGADEDQGVEDFLRSSSVISPTSPPSIPSEQRPNPAPPRIDTGSQWRSTNFPDEDRLEPLGFSMPSAPAMKKRHPKPPGTHVAFSNDAPAIIGEGGDEAELPANRVIGSWTPSLAQLQLGGGLELGGEDIEPPPVLQAGTDQGRRSSLQRAPTGRGGEVPWAQRRLSMSLEEGLIQAQKDIPDDEMNHREPTLPNIHFEPEPPIQPAVPIEEKSYVAMQSDRKPSVMGSPPNGAEAKSGGFLAYNPSLKSKVETSRPSTSEDSPQGSLLSPHGNQTNDPSLAVYPQGATVPQSSFDNLLHQPKLKSAHSPLPSPVIDQYGDIPNEHRQPTPATPEAAAADEFFTRMQHMRGIFKLTAERPRSVGANSLGQWLRASVWWFLRGKTDLENATRPSGPGSSFTGRGDDNLPSNKQCYVDMAKAWWILQEMVPANLQTQRGSMSQADVADGLNYDQLLQVVQRVEWEMSRFFHKLDGRGLLPPPELLVQGADPEIWIPYPTLPPAVSALTAGLNPHTHARLTPANPELAFSMPLTDSSAAFSYGRFFGLAHVQGDPNTPHDAPLPCVVSIIRDRSRMLAEFLLTTQDGQINLHVQSDRHMGLVWNAVKWNVKTSSMLVVLTAEIAVEVLLREPDFRVLYGVHDYNHKLESERMPRQDEELLFSDDVQAFHFMAPKDTKTGFPAYPVPKCRARLFQRNVLLAENSGSRKAFRCYRLSVASPPGTKTLSNVTRQFRDDKPVLFNNLRGEGGAPALALVMDENNKPASLIFTFESSLKRSAFHTILAGTATSPDECFSEDIPLHSLAVADVAGPSIPNPTPFSMPQGLQWQRLKVINLGQNLDEAPCLFSERLRVCMSSNFGSVTDRINLGSGELRIGFDPQDTTMLKLYRPAQNSLTISFLETAVRSKDVAQMSEILSAIASRPTCRVYKFLSLPVLHDFQNLATGFHVLYDNVATSFSINRRRKLMSSHKHLDTDHARIQILQGNHKTLLVAFFRSFALGKSMCLELNSSDVYEGSSSGGKFFAKFSDAKFAMPKPATEECNDLVCLDVVETPTEHDDLMFGFDSEDERNLFAKSLPAALSKPRMSFRKG